MEPHAITHSSGGIRHDTIRHLAKTRKSWYNELAFELGWTSPNVGAPNVGSDLSGSAQTSKNRLAKKPRKLIGANRLDRRLTCYSAFFRIMTDPYCRSSSR